MRSAALNPSTAQDNTAFIPARAGRVAILDRVYVSSDTALTVSLVDSASHNLKWRQYVGANGGSSAQYGTESAVGEGFDLSTSTTGNVFVWASYHYSDD